MKIHDLKILPEYFEAVLNGSKTFELRKDDRDIQVGDVLHLKEYDKTNGLYTGQMIIKKVLYILRNVPEYGLKEGYCIIGFNGMKGGKNEVNN